MTLRTPRRDEFVQSCGDTPPLLHETGLGLNRKSALIPTTVVLTHGMNWQTRGRNSDKHDKPQVSAT